MFGFRREQWPLFSSYTCWQQLVTQTKNLSKDHVALSEVYSTHLVSRLSQVMEDVQRIYKRVSRRGVFLRAVLTDVFSVARSATRRTRRYSASCTSCTPR